jgi:electron transfer flavoprotein alpha/beta subunit
MKVLVPVKRVSDFNVRVRVRTDGSGVAPANAKMSMNSFDEIAVEEAVRLKQARKSLRSYGGARKTAGDPCKLGLLQSS